MSELNKHIISLFQFQQFAIVDLTQNGIKDVVLQFSLAENNQAGFIILHDESGTIYSYTLVSRSMSDLKVDGTFIFSSGASDWGIGSLILSSSGYEIEKSIILRVFSILC